MSAQPKRLFFALLPENGVATKLHQLAHDAAVHNSGSVTQINTLHLTLLYLGNITQQQQECIEELVNEIAIEPFELSVNHISHWTESRVVWAGIEQIPPQLQQLADQISQAASRASIDCDNRFHPHITLLRKVKKLVDTPMFEPFQWRVNEFALVRSYHHPTGVEYRQLRHWFLDKL